jgi:hypothetical protein
MRRRQFHRFARVGRVARHAPQHVRPDNAGHQCDSGHDKRVADEHGDPGQRQTGKARCGNQPGLQSADCGDRAGNDVGRGDDAERKSNEPDKSVHTFRSSACWAISG